MARFIVPSGYRGIGLLHRVTAPLRRVIELLDRSSGYRIGSSGHCIGSSDYWIGHRDTASGHRDIASRHRDTASRYRDIGDCVGPSEHRGLRGCRFCVPTTTCLRNLRLVRARRRVLGLFEWHGVCEMGSMTPGELRDRTRGFAVAVTREVRPLLGDVRTRHACEQLMRCASSVAANYRAAGVARTRPEFIAKLSVVLEEADEVVFWLEYMRDTDSPTQDRWVGLLAEANQLVRIFAASRRTVTSRTPPSPPPRLKRK